MGDVQEALGLKAPWQCCPVVQLLTQSLADQGLVWPKAYFHAVVQNFGLTLIITWTITYFYDVEQITNHPMRPVMGNLNPCFGWDYPPASYIALTMMGMNVYFAWRFAFLENARTKLQTSQGVPACIQCFTKFSNWSVAFASNLWLVLWLVGPTSGQPEEVSWDIDHGKMHGWGAHIMLFGLYTICTSMSVLGSYLEVRFSSRSSVIEPKHTAFVVILLFTSFYLIAVYMYNFFLYEMGKPPALGSMYPTMVADILWTFCLTLYPVCAVPEVPLKITVEMATDSVESDKN